MIFSIRMEKEGKFDKIGIWILKKLNKLIPNLLENVQVIQNDLATNFYDALVEQNSIYLDGETELRAGQGEQSSS